MTGRGLRSDPAVWGGAVWLVTAAAGGAGLGGLTLLDAVLLLGILVIVPMAVPLHPAANSSHGRLSLLAAAGAAPALLLGQGVPAGLLVLPWLAVSGGGAALAAAWWLSRGGRAVEAIWVAAPAYLTVGAGWLVADRLDLEPAGFAAPFVLLTAIHFHYAGFASSLLAGCVLRRRPGRLPVAAAVLVAAAPPVVAIGFTSYGPLQVVGAVLLTLGLWLLAWEMVRRVGPRTGGAAGALLICSGLATLAPMVLAVQWAVGANYATPALSIPDMARWHGVTNAVGFTFLGVLGWRLIHTPAPGGPATSARTVPGPSEAR